MDNLDSQAQQIHTFLTTKYDANDIADFRIGAFTDEKAAEKATVLAEYAVAREEIQARFPETTDISKLIAIAVHEPNSSMYGWNDVLHRFDDGTNTHKDFGYMFAFMIQSDLKDCGIASEILEKELKKAGGLAPSKLYIYVDPSQPGFEQGLERLEQARIECLSTQAKGQAEALAKTLGKLPGHSRAAVLAEVAGILNSPLPPHERRKPAGPIPFPGRG